MGGAVGGEGVIRSRISMDGQKQLADGSDGQN